MPAAPAGSGVSCGSRRLPSSTSSATRTQPSCAFDWISPRRRSASMQRPGPRLCSPGRYRDTENVVHPGLTMSPFSTVSSLLGAEAVRPTMEYFSGLLIQ